MKRIKRILVLSMSLCMMTGLLTVPAHAEEIPVTTEEINMVTEDDIEEFISNPENISLVNQGICYIDTRGATDEYYYLESINYYGDEKFLKNEYYSQYFNAGNYVVSLAVAVASSIFAPGSGELAYATFNNAASIALSFTKVYNIVVQHYYKLANMTYRVENAMGQTSRYASYSAVKVPTRKVYTYN